MKLEIEVELPKHIMDEFEVARIGVPVDGDVVISSASEAEIFYSRKHDSVPRVILRRKLNPSDWWPKWVLADTITFEKNGSIGFYGDDGHGGYWRGDTNLWDSSWIPEYLRRSGITIKNPWKGEQQ